ncbi:thioredoxin family protein [uncultured Bifidobacterium sp.]|uniref:thioredoxin family protein n=1 Tax=uncultured Bifidobacterium sp. TaxID=165187 RepID=UPI0025978812|nr:thioredoxin family protein [uncultured Bifidobacterium sp.]
MGLFGTTTKKRDIGGNGNARVRVMGTGCRKCHALYEAATEALGADQVDYVTDMARIAEAGVMTTPALVMDGTVVSAGKVLTADEIRTLIGERS